MRRYEAYKDSGVEWIGEIPEGWGAERLKTQLEERKESNNPIKTDFILSLTNTRGVIPYSEKGDIGNKAKEDLSSYRLARPGDIVLNSMNVVIGSVGLSRYFGAVSPVYYMLFPRDEQSDVRYFNYIFQMPAFQDSLKGLGNGIMEIRMRIPMSKLNDVKLPIPSTGEQRAIADYLDEKTAEIDSIVSQTDRSIELLREYRKSVISEAVTKGLDPDAPMKDSGVEWIGEIPEGWEVSAVRYIGSCSNGLSKAGEFFGSGYPFISYGNVYRDELDCPELYGLVQSTEKEREACSLHRGDILFTRTSENIEEVAISATVLEDIENATFAGFLIRLRPFETCALIPEFSRYYFKAEKHREYFNKEMMLVTRASLSQDLLKGLAVLIPPLPEQQAIADYLDKKTAEIDSLISDKQRQVELLKEYRKSLISEAVTGKFKVPGLE